MQPQEKAKQLRQNATQAEKIMWHQLRSRKLNSYKFRRQYTIEHYIVDFVCLSAKLIIELDGKHHHEPEQQNYDQIRTQFLQADGYKILRFTNEQVTNDLPSVLKTIQSAVKSRKAK